MRVTRVGVVCVLIGLVSAVPATSAQPRSPSYRAQAMVKKLNQVRVRHGLPALRPSGSLSRSSRSFSHWQMARDAFGHRGGRAQASGRFRNVGEVLAVHRGHRLAVRGTIRAWLRSPAHRSVILSRAMPFVGAGATYGRFRGRRTTIWVVQLGRR